MSAATGLLQVAVAMSGVFVVEALGTLVSLVIMLFLLFFFLRDGEAMLDTALHLVPLDAERQGHLLLHLSAVTRAVVFGSLITAVIQGTLVGVSFAIIGLPSPVVFGVLAMLAALVPLFGTALIWVPAAGVLAAQRRWGAAIFMAAWGSSSSRDRTTSCARCSSPAAPRSRPCRSSSGSRAGSAPSGPSA